MISERKKVSAEQKSVYKENRDAFAEEIEALKNAFVSKELQAQACETKLDDILSRMRNTPLGKFEIRELRDMTRVLREAFTHEANAEDALRREKALKKEQEKREKIDALKQEIQNIDTNKEPEELEDAISIFSKELATFSVSRVEKQEFERLIRNIRDLIAEKKEAKLLSLSDGDREAIGKLKMLLKERKAHRQEIKANIEMWRKESGSSGLDFAQAIQYNEMIENERARLEKVEAGIKEIEEKIEELQGN